MIRIAILTLMVIGGTLSAHGQVPVTTSTGTPTNLPPAPDLSTIEIPAVGFCDLVGNPDKYDNQIVRTQAILNTGFEASVLNLPNCDKFDTWASFDPSYDGKAKESKKLYKILSKEKDGLRRADVTIVGRFVGKKQILIKLKDKTYYTGYGHMNSYSYEFMIMRVESAKTGSTKSKS